MNSKIVTDATDELVRTLAPRVLENLQQAIEGRTHLSINRVAGMLEVSPDTVKRLFAGKIAVLSQRQQRISIKDIDTVMESLKAKAEKKRARLDKMKDQANLEL